MSKSISYSGNQEVPGSSKQEFSPSLVYTLWCNCLEKVRIDRIDSLQFRVFVIVIGRRSLSRFQQHFLNKDVARLFSLGSLFRIHALSFGPWSSRLGMSWQPAMWRVPVPCPIRLPMVAPRYCDRTAMVQLSTPVPTSGASVAKRLYWSCNYLQAISSCILRRRVHSKHAVGII